MSTYKRGGITYRMKPFDVDRTPFLEELTTKPGLIAAARAMVKSEAGGMTPDAQQKVFGTMLNRSAGLGTTLEDTIRNTGKRYYQPYHNGAFARNYGPANSEKNQDFYNKMFVDEITNPTTSRSHNASADVARSAIKGGWDAVPYKLGGGEIADKEYLYDKRFKNEKDFQRMARTVVPAPGVNPERTFRPELVEEERTVGGAEPKGILSDEEIETGIIKPAAAPMTDVVKTVPTPPMRPAPAPPSIQGMGRSPTGNAGISSPAMISGYGRDPAMANPEDEIDPRAAVTPVARVNAAIDRGVIRGDDGRIRGIAIPSKEDDLERLKSVYGDVGAARSAAADAAFKPKGLSTMQLLGGGLTNVGAAIAIAQGGPGAAWGRGALSNNLLTQHVQSQSELAAKLAGKKFDITDQSLVGGGDVELEYVKKKHAERAAARKRANSLLQVYKGPGGQITSGGIQAAASALRAAGLDEDASKLEVAFADELGPTEEQKLKIEGLHTTGPGDLEGTPERTFEAGSGVYGAGSSVDPAIADEESVRAYNKATRSGIPQSKASSIMPTDDLRQAEAQIKELRQQSSAAAAEGMGGLSKQLSEKADNLAKLTGIHEYSKQRGKNLADTLRGMNPQERMELRKEMDTASKKIAGRDTDFRTAEMNLNLLVDPRTGKMTKAASNLFGNWSDYLGVPPTPGTPEAAAMAAYNSLEGIFSLEGLAMLREAGVSPGPMTEKEWPLMRSRMAAMGRGQAPKDAAKQFMNVYKMFEEGRRSQRTSFERIYGTSLEDYRRGGPGGGSEAPDRTSGGPQEPSGGDTAAVGTSQSKAEDGGLNGPTTTYRGSPELAEDGKPVAGTLGYRTDPETGAKILVEVVRVPQGEGKPDKLKWRRSSIQDDIDEEERNLPPGA